MTNTYADWERQVLELWGTLDSSPAEEFVSRMEVLAAERPTGEPSALFERGSAQDSTGHPDRAIPLYRAALDAGLSGPRRRRATIQLGSSLRSLGHADQAVKLLRGELDADSDELDGAVQAFLALALVDVGCEREAVTASLTALSAYLPRYNRSLARYARALTAAPFRSARPDRASLDTPHVV